MIEAPTKVIIRRKDRIDYIVEGLCSHYQVSKDELLQTKARTPETYKRKGITIKLLRDIADISLKEISYLFTYGDEATTWRIYQEYHDVRNNDTEYNNIVKTLGI